MKLTTYTQVSVDGVMQANGGNNPILDPGFERGGWAQPLFDDESHAYVNDVYQRADAFLFGRRTFDLFARYWGPMEKGVSPIADSMNTRPKYVASNSLTDSTWKQTAVLSGDSAALAAQIRELKARPGGELQVHGSGAFVGWLLENDLGDEISLLVIPVIVGAGTRLFPERGRDVALELVDSRAFPSGVVLQVYRPGGRPQYA